ncbi:MAG: DUF4783 domain-containing protein [Cryomorphaceae bacterium]|nr:DUF4783 domain-containing protein [Cryomorphaceae bacterium]
MKTLLTLGFALLATVMIGQEDISAKVAGALSKGNAALIGSYLVPSVDLTILDDEDMYPKDQVVRKLESFFAKNPPISFDIKHKGTSKLDDHYRIGDLVTKTGKYRVTFFMKKGQDGMKIKQLRIEDYNGE